MARTASAAVTVWAAVFGLIFLFAPIHGGCRVGVRGEVEVGPGGTVTTTNTVLPQVCEFTSLVARQEVWPTPFLWIALWSLAPMLAAIGIWTSARPRMWLVYLALLLALTAMMSFAAGPLFLLFVVLPLAVVTYLAQRAAASGVSSGSVDAQAGGGG